MPKSIDLQDVQRLSAEGAQVVDVMPRETYEESRLPGALHLSLAELDEATAAQLDRDRPVIVYCADHE
jgi:rhodanese-related sulfurtransferase